MNGFSRLHRTLNDHAKRNMNTLPTSDFGTIQSDLSLKMDHFNDPIPSSDYRHCKSITPTSGMRVLVSLVGNEIVVIDEVV